MLDLIIGLCIVLGLLILVIAIIVAVTILLLGAFGVIHFRIKIREKPNANKAEGL